MKNFLVLFCVFAPTHREVQEDRLPQVVLYQWRRFEGVEIAIGIGIGIDIGTYQCIFPPASIPIPIPIAISISKKS
jgi:hypothetical protein